MRKYINSHALPLVSSEKEHVSETRCQRHNCSLENKHTVGSSVLLVCHAHTHTHKNTFNPSVPVLIYSDMPENVQSFKRKREREDKRKRKRE